MAVNRFDQLGKLDLSFKVYNPVEWQPNAALWDNVFGGLQQELNDIRDFKAPKHIKESSDAVAKQMQSIYDQRDAIIDAYKNGNFSQGRQMQNELITNITRSQQPGGWFYDEEQLYNNYTSIIEKQDELLEDDPAYWKNYARQAVKTKGSQIDSNGEYIVGSVNAPTIGKWQDISKDIMDQLNGFQSDKGSIIKTDKGFRYVETNEVVSDKDIMSAAMNIIANPRFQQQIQIESEGLGFTQQTIIDDTNQKMKIIENSLQTNDPNNIKLIQNHLYAEGYWDKEIDGKTGDELNKAIAKYKADLLKRDPSKEAQSKIIENYINPVVAKLGFNKKEIKYLTEITSSIGKSDLTSLDFSDLSTAQTTELVTNGTGMLPSDEYWQDVRFNTSGRVVFNAVSSGISPEPGAERLISGGIKQYSKEQQAVQPYFKEYMKTQGKEKHPEMYSIYSQFSKQIEGMDDKQALDFVNKMYKKKYDSMSVTAHTVYGFTNIKDLNAFNDRWLGEVKGDGVRVGEIQNSRILLDTENGVEEVTYAELLSRLGLDGVEGAKNFVESTTLTGQLRPDNPIVPSGFRANYKDPNNPKNTYSFTIENEQRKYDPKYSTLFAFSQPLYKGSVNKSKAIQSDLPMFAGIGRIYTKAQDVWEIDQLKTDYAKLKKIEDQGGKLSNLQEDELKTIEARLKEIQRNPESNEYIERTAYFYDANDNPIMTADGRHLSVDDYRELQNKYYNP